MALSLSGPLTPYITPQILTNAPTGITWKTIPTSRATPQEQLAEQMNLCVRATSMIDTVCNNVLRATIDTETLYGPNYRLTINNQNGIARAMLSRYPVLQILGGQVSPAVAFPPQWTEIPVTSFAIERPVIGIYGTSAPSASGDGGQSVLIAPGNVSWAWGRSGCQLQVQYVNGWPHTALTASASAGDSTLEVNDCTAWGPQVPGGQGAAGIIYDGNDQESAEALAASATSGPGTLTLSAPLTFTHGAGTVFSALPTQIMDATILFAMAQALRRGATATVIQSVSGMGEATASGHYELMQIAKELAWPYRRVI